MNRLTLLLIIGMLSPMLLTLEAQQFDDVPESVKERKSFLRHQWFYEQRVYPNDTLEFHKLQLEKQKIQMKMETDSPEDDLVWINVGPQGIFQNYPPHWGTASGRARGLAIDPANENIVYIGTASGGLWKTTDGGQVWISLSDDFGAITFGAIAIDPVNTNNIYAGTGEAIQYFGNIYYGRGLYKSTDGGSSFINITDGFGEITHFGDIIVNPDNPDIVLAALASGNRYVRNLNNEGVWRSTNAGLTWSQTLIADNAFDLLFHPNDPSIVYAATGGATGSAGFYISTDGGQSFTKSSNGLPSSATIGRMQIDISQTNPNILYAIIFNSPTSAWKSTDGGNNWTQISPGTNLGGYAGSWYDQGYYDLCIAVDPNDPDLCWFGNVELHKTENGGDISPVRINPNGWIWDSPVHADYHRIVYAPSNSNYIFIVSDGGIFRSTDRGGSWHDLNNNLNTVQFYRIASHPTDPDIIVGGAQDNGVMRTLDRGATDYSLVSTGDGMVQFFDYDDPNVLYGSIQWGALFKNTTGGSFNNNVDISPPYVAQTAWTTPFWMHPTDNNTLYTAGYYIWKSTNGGGSWFQRSGYLTASAIVDVSQSSLDPNKMIMTAPGTIMPIVMVSTDDGVNWTDISGNIPDLPRYIPRVYCDPWNANSLYIIKSGFGTGKLYHSTDFGSTWINKSGNLPDIPTSDLFIDPEIPGNLYIANDAGVYRSTDAGASWERTGSNIPIVPCIDFDYAEYPDYRLLRIGTYGKSIYEAQLPDASTQFLQVITPSDGQALTAGSYEEITWASNLVDSLNMYLSTNNGLTWSVIFSSIPGAAGSIDWLVPASYSQQCKLKFEDAYDPSFTIQSEGLFSIEQIAPPQLSSPENGAYNIDNEPVHFQWQPAAGASGYHFQLSSDSLFSSYIVNDSTLTEPEISVSDLENYTRYYWRVQSMNIQYSSGFTGASTFTTVLAAPELIYPAHNADNVPIDAVLSWLPSSGADFYHLLLSESPFFQINVINDSTIANTEYQPVSLEEGTAYYWKVKAKNSYGGGSFSQFRKFTTAVINSVDGQSGIPDDFVLHQNYPNPFNPSTSIRFGVPAAANVRVEIYDINGKRAALLLQERKNAGYYELTWNAAGFASGIYLLRLTAVEEGSNKIYENNLKLNLIK